MILLEVPLYPQETKDTCADACAKMCIGYYLQKGIVTGKSTDVPSEQTLVAEYGMESIIPIVDGLKDYNGVSFSCTDITSYSAFRQIIENSLRSGHPVVLDIQTDSTALFGYKTAGHYVVVTGLMCDKEPAELLINDPYHKDGEGIGQTIRLSADAVFDTVKYMVCKTSLQE